MTNNEYRMQPLKKATVRAESVRRKQLNESLKDSLTRYRALQNLKNSITSSYLNETHSMKSKFSFLKRGKLLKHIERLGLVKRKTVVFKQHSKRAIIYQNIELSKQRYQFHLDRSFKASSKLNISCSGSFSMSDIRFINKIQALVDKQDKYFTLKYQKLLKRYKQYLHESNTCETSGLTKNSSIKKRAVELSKCFVNIFKQKQGTMLSECMANSLKTKFSKIVKANLEVYEPILKRKTAILKQINGYQTDLTKDDELMRLSEEKGKEQRNKLFRKVIHVVWNIEEVKRSKLLYTLKHQVISFAELAHQVIIRSSGNRVFKGCYETSKRKYYQEISQLLRTFRFEVVIEDKSRIMIKAVHAIRLIDRYRYRNYTYCLQTIEDILKQVDCFEKEANNILQDKGLFNILIEGLSNSEDPLPSLLTRIPRDNFILKLQSETATQAQQKEFCLKTVVNKHLLNRQFSRLDSQTQIAISLGVLLQDELLSSDCLKDINVDATELQNRLFKDIVKTKGKVDLRSSISSYLSNTEHQTVIHIIKSDLSKNTSLYKKWNLLERKFCSKLLPSKNGVDRLSRIVQFVENKLQLRWKLPSSVNKTRLLRSKPIFIKHEKPKLRGLMEEIKIQRRPRRALSPFVEVVQENSDLEALAKSYVGSQVPEITANISDKPPKQVIKINESFRRELVRVLNTKLNFFNETDLIDSAHRTYILSVFDKAYIAFVETGAVLQIPAPSIENKKNDLLTGEVNKNKRSNLEPKVVSLKKIFDEIQLIDTPREPIKPIIKSKRKVILGVSPFRMIYTYNNSKRKTKLLRDALKTVAFIKNHEQRRNEASERYLMRREELLSVALKEHLDALEIDFQEKRALRKTALMKYEPYFKRALRPLLKHNLSKLNWRKYFNRCEKKVRKTSYTIRPETENINFYGLVSRCH